MNDMACVRCERSIGVEYDAERHLWIPTSLYWKGTPRRVDRPYCGPECSLDEHEQGEDK